MPRVSVVAKNYAKSLFAAGLKTNSSDGDSLEKIQKDLDIFKQNFSLDFARELKNPVISKDDAVKIILDIAKKINLGKLVSNFLAAVTRNKRLNLFPEIYLEFIRLAKIEKNILDIEVISAQEIDDKTIDSLRLALNKKYPDKSLEFNKTIKKEILGGLQIKIGSDLIDASLKNQLATIASQLARVVK